LKRFENQPQLNKEENQGAQHRSARLLSYFISREYMCFCSTAKSNIQAEALFNKGKK